MNYYYHDDPRTDTLNVAEEIRVSILSPVRHGSCVPGRVLALGDAEISITDFEVLVT